MRVKEGPVVIHFRLCPCCARAVPSISGERFCPNDGTPLLEHCPNCETNITNPTARHCTQCGHELVKDTT